MPLSVPIRSDLERCNMQKEPVEYGININIFKCIQVVLNILFVRIHLSCKKSQLSKEICQIGAQSGQIRSNPMIRPHLVCLRTLHICYEVCPKLGRQHH